MNSTATPVANAEQHGVEPAGAVGEGHQHLGPPLLRHPGAGPRTCSVNGSVLREARGEDDLADLDVPQRARVVEPALAEGEEQHQPDARRRPFPVEAGVSCAICQLSRRIRG